MLKAGYGNSLHITLLTVSVTLNDLSIGKNDN